MDITQQARERIIVALDVPTETEALSLVEQLKGKVGIFKVGLELIYHEGIQVVQKIMQAGCKVFLDVKLKDIPNTVAGASRGIARLGVAMFNVHAMGGLEMMRAAIETTSQESRALKIERPKVLAVTVLTSINGSIMNEEIGIQGKVVDQVVRLAILAREAGLDGVIASPQEIRAIRQHVSEEMLIVTPGVRPIWAAVGDQRRVMTPSEAVSQGATFLVIGRPITKPPQTVREPSLAAQLIAEEIATAMSSL